MAANDLQMIIPYRTGDHIYVRQIDNHVIYTDLYNNTNFIFPHEAHECILSGDYAKSDGLEEYLCKIASRLISAGYIEPDLTKIRLGKASIYIPRSKWEPGKEFNKNDLKGLINKEYLTPAFNFENINEKHDYKKYEFLCVRNSLRVAMQGYGIKSPLLWMTGGLFISDDDFMATGRFNTSFSRPMIDTGTIPILGNDRYGLDWEIIDMHLARGLPVLAGVDVYHLPYDSNHYHKQHGSHSIVLLKKRNSGYLILDWYHPDYFIGELATVELEIARTSENEKDRDGVFTGQPILASYKLIYLDRFPLSLDIIRYIKNNLLSSVKIMLAEEGAISFINNAINTPPEWLKLPKGREYINAIESCFFFDLELKFLIIYLEEMANYDFCCPLKPDVLLSKTKEIRGTLDKLRYKLVLATRKDKVIESSIWAELLTEVNIVLGSYCESILRLMKEC